MWECSFAKICETMVKACFDVYSDIDAGTASLQDPHQFGSEYIPEGANDYARLILIT